jgi:hypothetical protein
LQRSSHCSKLNLPSKSTIHKFLLLISNMNDIHNDQAS